MENQNKLAKEWYRVVYNELQDLVIQHYQISNTNSLHESLPKLAARIRQLGACLEVWKYTAKYNATRKFMGG